MSEGRKYSRRSVLGAGLIALGGVALGAREILSPDVKPNTVPDVDWKVIQPVRFGGREPNRTTMEIWHDGGDPIGSDQLELQINGTPIEDADRYGVETRFNDSVEGEETGAFSSFDGPMTEEDVVSIRVGKEDSTYNDLVEWPYVGDRIDIVWTSKNGQKEERLLRTAPAFGREYPTHVTWDIEQSTPVDPETEETVRFEITHTGAGRRDDVQEPLIGGNLPPEPPEDDYVPVEYKGSIVAEETSKDEDELWVISKRATNVNANTAMLHGELKNLGGADSVQVYFEWERFRGDISGSTEPQELTSPGEFSHELDLSDLPDSEVWDKRFRFQAKAETGDQTDTGNVGEFRPRDPPLGIYIRPAGVDTTPSQWKKIYQSPPEDAGDDFEQPIPAYSWVEEDGEKQNFANLGSRMEEGDSVKFKAEFKEDSTPSAGDLVSMTWHKGWDIPFLRHDVEGVDT